MASYMARAFRSTHKIYQHLTRNRCLSLIDLIPKYIRFSVNTYDRFRKVLQPGCPAVLCVMSVVAMKNADGKLLDNGSCKQQILKELKEGELQVEKGRYAAAIEIFENSLRLSEKAFAAGLFSEHERLIADTLINNAIGNCYLRSGCYIAAEDEIKKTIQSYQQLTEDKFDEAAMELTLRLSNCYAVNGKMEEAKESFDMIIGRLITKIKNDKELCTLNTYRVLWSAVQVYGRFLVKFKEYQKAEEMFSFGDELVVGTRGEDAPERHDLLNDWAGVKILQSEFESAEKLFQTAVDVGVKQRMPNVCFTYCSMGRLYTRLSDWEKAEKMCNLGLDVASKFKNEKCRKSAETCLKKLNKAKDKAV